MSKTTDAAALVGRILLALMFVISGFGKIGAFDDTTVFMARAGIPAVSVLLMLTILIELGGGVAIIVGWRTREIALVIAVFVAIVTLVFHAFWTAPAEQRMVQQLMFMKNLSIIGGLLVLVAFGPGDWALDDRDR